MRLALLLAVAFGLAGCGVGAGERTVDDDVRFLVTRDFGDTLLESAETKHIPAGETVMRFMQRRWDVQTRYGGGFVQAIEGLAGDSGHKIDWFYYVNGIEAAEGAAARRLDSGDQVWWDRHDWSAAMRVPAVVGSFPEPFASGSEGRRLPVRVDCATPSARECDEVMKRLAAQDVKAAQAPLGQTAGREVLRILVGTWIEVRKDPVAVQLERGPATSGVFARPHGRSLDLLDPTGRVVRTVRDAVGLIAATRFEDQQPTWVVTGTDAAGVAAAASALDPEVLESKFAVAIERGLAEGLPLTP